MLHAAEIAFDVPDRRGGAEKIVQTSVDDEALRAISLRTLQLPGDIREPPFAKFITSKGRHDSVRNGQPAARLSPTTAMLATAGLRATAASTWRDRAESCSLACAVFFPRNVVTVEEAPQRSDAEAMPALGKLCGRFLERDVAALLVDERRDQTEMRVDARRPTVPPRGLAAGLPVSFSRAHQRSALAAATPKRQNAQPPVGATCRLRRRRQRVLEDQAKGSSSTCMPASFASRQLESEPR